jgi:hypothetical protein
VLKLILSTVNEPRKVPAGPAAGSCAEAFEDQRLPLKGVAITLVAIINIAPVSNATIIFFIFCSSFLVQC